MNRKAVLVIVLALAMILPLIPLGIVHALPCLQTATGSGEVCLDFSAGIPIGNTAMGQPPYLIGQGGFWPHGFFVLGVNSFGGGSTIVVTMTFPSPIPVGTRWTWLDITTNTWSTLSPGLVSINGGNVVTLSLTDNSPEDLVPILGTIQHIGGPNIPLSAPETAEGASYGESSATTIGSPNLRVAMLNVAGQTTVNQPVTITANVVNDGDMEGSTRVALKINGQVEQTQMVNVGPGGSRPVKFTVTKAEPGTYTVIIGSQRASFLVTEDTAGGTSVDGGIIAILFLVLLAATVVIVLALSFRRKPTY